MHLNPNKEDMTINRLDIMNIVHLFTNQTKHNIKVYYSYLVTLTNEVVSYKSKAFMYLFKLTVCLIMSLNQRYSHTRRVP